MGINVHVYSIYGVRTEWNNEFYEDYEAREEENIDKYGYNNPVPVNEQVEVLVDGMGGEYFVFGEQLYDSGDSRWGEMVNSNEVEINQEILDNMKTEYMARFKRLYPKHYEWLAARPWRLVNLVHYS